MLWSMLADSGALLLRVPESAGGGEMGLLDAAVVAEQFGRYLASAPLLEGIVAARLLAAVDSPAAVDWLERLGSGDAIVSLALQITGKSQIVPAGAIANAILWLDGDTLRLSSQQPDTSAATPTVFGSLPHRRMEFSQQDAIALASGQTIREHYLAAIEELKLLTAAAVVGATKAALELAAQYSCDRQAFGKPIGSYQGVSHPLADSVTEHDGAQLLVWRAIWAIERKSPESGALISAAFWFASQTFTRAVTRSMRVFGGYGMSMEYDVQLYFRRGRGWILGFGDPAAELRRTGQRLWGGATTSLPEPGESGIDFRWGEQADALASKMRAFFVENLEERHRDFAYHSDDAHDPALFRKMASARLLYPEWPEQYLGRACDAASMAAVQEAFNEFDFPILVPVVTDMVGKMLLLAGTEEARQELLPKFANGDAYCSLGYSEPSGGSDLFAAKTRAVRDGDEWILNGQKMFTTQGHLADYAILLARTDPDAPKHAGLTLFVVPLRQSGYESHEVKTLGHERTNITYYTDMRIPDRYRLGEINGGAKTMASALKLEQGVGLYNVGPMQRLLKHALKWARNTMRDGEPAIDSDDVRSRLAKLYVSIQVADGLTRRSIWASEEGISQKWFGSMSKLFGSEAWLSTASDLMDLAAPDTLECQPSDAGWIEIEYRRSVPSTIYGGTSEVHRSIIAESALKMPRSRA